ncbi:MAG: GNAT family N-acetyltransferase [Parvibaculum sp.]|uniref:GNAT family N-acetyltransferase n=1 Tax=Parvibaculum sp. TaxID=2024848 RepID=UPI0025D9D0FE|nr:GNAT family N-acetyltransferase [Parvibaculum sp.]MCE9648167.1 GNAT family N-acetyltransferase [Parvibaculum sp.]
MSEYEIVAGGVDDAASMAALHAAAFDEPWTAKAMTEILAMPGTYVLLATDADVRFGNNGVSHGNIAGGPQAGLSGFVIARVAADEAEILTLAVDISKRGQGLGRKLMEAAAARALASGAAALFLEVADDNVAALALYERLGFVTMGLRPAYYARAGGSVAARNMRLSLGKT